MRIQCAKCNARLIDSEPLTQRFARDLRNLNDEILVDRIDHIPQWHVSRRKDDPQFVGRQHHRNAGVRELGKHFRVSRKIVAPRKQRRLVDWSGDDSLHFAAHCLIDSLFDRKASEFSGNGRITR